ncbi:hypothetical protein BGZ91_009974, partial [Linnemannia elongata]
TLEPYNRLEEWPPSFKKRDEFFNHTKTHELEDYADDMAIIQTRLAHLTRPIDATVHAILASHPMDIEDPVLINTIETFDILRYNLVFIAAEITHLRKEALYRDKKIIPPADPNDKTSLITHQQFIDQKKFTHSLRKASGQVGRGRGGFNSLGNRNGQQNNNFDNSLENSENNSGNNGFG